MMLEVLTMMNERRLRLWLGRLDELETLASNHRWTAADDCYDASAVVQKQQSILASQLEDDLP